MNLKPRRTGPGRVAPNSCSGASPRNRYIGLASELPPVSSMASRTPSASNSVATSTLSSSHSPPGTPSAMLSLAVTAARSPTASRTARRTWRAKRARFSTLPPNWSSRRLSLGLKNALNR